MNFPEVHIFKMTYATYVLRKTQKQIERNSGFIYTYKIVT